MLGNFLHSWPDPRLPFYCKPVWQWGPNSLQPVKASSPSNLQLGICANPCLSPGVRQKGQSIPRITAASLRRARETARSPSVQSPQVNTKVPLALLSPQSRLTFPSPENEGKLNLCLSKSSWDVGAWQTLRGKGALESGCPTKPPALVCFSHHPWYRRWPVTSTKCSIA